MNLDRLKSNIIRSIASTLPIVANNHRKQRAINFRRQTYIPPTVPKYYQNKLDRAELPVDHRQSFEIEILKNALLTTDTPEMTTRKIKNLQKIDAQIQAQPRRRREGLSGKGDYTWRNFGGDILTGLGGAAGAAAGVAAGGGLVNPYSAYYGGVGSSVGAGLGTELGQLIGMGDYSVKMNTLSKNSFALQPGQPVPQFGGISNNATRVKHREFVRDIVVPVNPSQFNNVSTPINPGNITLFPWLSQVASQYQQYQIHGMVVEFRTLSSDVTSGGALGSVIIATNYDVLEGAYADKVRMENAQYSVSTKPSCGLLHTVECDPAQRPTKMLYVRDVTSSGTVSQDARFMDLGLLQIATAGLPGVAGQVLGELWVSYDISFYKPEISSQVTSFQLVNTFVGSTVALPLGTSSNSGGSQFFSLNNSASSFLALVTGTYVFELEAGQTAIGSLTWTPSAGATSSNLSIVASVTQLISIQLVTISAVGATVVLATTGTAYNTNSLRIFKIV